MKSKGLDVFQTGFTCNCLSNLSATYSIYSEYLNSIEYTIYNVTNINITTSYSNAWRLFFNSTDMIYSVLNYEINDIVDGINVKFSPPLGNIYLKIVDISTQIAPGWIE